MQNVLNWSAFVRHWNIGKGKALALLHLINSSRSIDKYLATGETWRSFTRVPRALAESISAPPFALRECGFYDFALQFTLSPSIS